VNDYLGQFVAAGLLVERQTGYAYGPTTSRLEQAVSELGRAYNERPVTLIAAIHRIADRRNQSFSASFKLRDG
jgi:hypothetical protein